MIAVSLNVGGGVRIIKPAKLYVHAKHYKHNEDGRTAPGVCGNGSVALSYSGNFVTRIGIHTHTHTHTALSLSFFVSVNNKTTNIYLFIVEYMPKKTLRLSIYIPYITFL